MKKYHMALSVRSVEGTQTWEILAEDPKDALSRYKKGEGKLIDEELDVGGLHEPELGDIWEAE